MDESTQNTLDKHLLEQIKQKRTTKGVKELTLGVETKMGESRNER